MLGDGCGFVGLYVSAAAAGGYQVDTAEDEQYGADLGEVEGLHAPAYGDECSDERLDVVVHSGDGRPQVFLTDDDEHIAQEGTADNDEDE